MAVSYTKKGKLLFIVQEFEKRDDRYNINGINRVKAKYFARFHQGQFEEIPLGNYRIAEQGNQVYLLITNQEYLAKVERLQVCYEFASISSDYEVELGEVDVNTLTNKYNQLVEDVKNLFKYVQTNMMTADSLDVFNILPQLDADEVWVKTENGWRGLNIGNLEANIQGLLTEMKNTYNKYMTDIKRIGDGYEKDISFMGNTFKREMTDIKNANYAEINGLGMKYKTDIQSMGEMYLGNIAGSFEREVLQGKADIDKHTDEKLEVLDSSTALDMQELENKKTACIGELNKHTGDKKVELQLYEQELENQLAEFPALKKSEIDNYINNTSLPSIDVHTATKIDALDDHILLKKGELDTYEKDKEKELDTYNKTNIGKYDKEIREGLSTYQMFLVNEMDAHAKEVTTPKVQEIVQAGVENARSQVAGEVAKVTAEGDKQVIRVQEEGERQIEKIQQTSVEGKQDKIDQALQTQDKSIVGAINELKAKKLDATGGLVSGELDIDTQGRNAIRMMMNGDVKGYVYPFEDGVTFAGNREQTSGITVNNRLNKTIANHGFVVKDSLAIQDFLNKNEFATMNYHVAEEEYPFKAFVMNNVEHLVLADQGSYYRVYSEKNFDPNSKFNVTGGDLEGNLTIKKDGLKTFKFIDSATNDYGEITCDGGTGDMYIKNRRSNKTILMDVSGNTTIDANNLQTSSKEVIGAINELKEVKLNKQSERLTTTAKDVIGAINEINAKDVDTSTLVKKTGDTMTGSLTVGDNSHNSKLRVVGISDNLALATPNDEANYIAFVKNNAGSTVRKGYVGFGSHNSNSFLIKNDMTNNYISLGDDKVITANAIVKTTVDGARAIQATRGNYTALMGCSSTQGDFLFGGKANSASDYEDYVRVGRNKLQYTTGGTTNNILHAGNCPISASRSSGTSGPYMSGYSKLANGLITQWGYITINANTKTQVTLPTSFDSQYYSVSYDVPAQSEFNKTVYLDRWGSGSFTMNNQTKHKYTMFWLAIGKSV